MESVFFTVWFEVFAISLFTMMGNNSIFYFTIRIPFFINNKIVLIRQSKECGLYPSRFLSAKMKIFISFQWATMVSELRSISMIKFSRAGLFILSGRPIF
jgi:hypothetical protein